MSFADAWFVGQAELAGISAGFVGSLQLSGATFESGNRILATDACLADITQYLRVNVLVDARMRKKEVPVRLIGIAPLTIGTGPGFCAGEHVDVVIETAWGSSLGTAVFVGSVKPYDGKHREVDGHGRDRYVYSPNDGTFETRFRIGHSVRAGELVGMIGDWGCLAPLDGVLRGLCANGAVVREGYKLVEVAPTADTGACFGIANRASKIAEGVLEAIELISLRSRNEGVR